MGESPWPAAQVLNKDEPGFLWFNYSNGIGDPNT